MNLFLFLIILFFFLSMRKSATGTAMGEKPLQWSCCFALLAYLFFLLLFLIPSIRPAESFRFEVSPEKKCRQCSRGFNGMNIGFEYTGDAERMEISKNCMLASRAEDEQEQLVEGFEGGCSSCMM